MIDEITKNSHWTGPVIAGVLTGVAIASGSTFDWIVAYITGVVVAFGAGYRISKEYSAKLSAIREKETKIDGVTYGENGKAKKVTVWKN